MNIFVKLICSQRWKFPIPDQVENVNPNKVICQSEGGRTSCRKQLCDGNTTVLSFSCKFPFCQTKVAGKKVGTHEGVFRETVSRRKIT